MDNFSKTYIELNDRANDKLAQIEGIKGSWANELAEMSKQPKFKEDTAYAEESLQQLGNKYATLLNDAQEELASIYTELNRFLSEK